MYVHKCRKSNVKKIRCEVFSVIEAYDRYKTEELELDRDSGSRHSRYDAALLPGQMLASFFFCLNYHKLFFVPD